MNVPMAIIQLTTNAKTAQIPSLTVIRVTLNPATAAQMDFCYKMDNVTVMDLKTKNLSLTLTLENVLVIKGMV